MRVKQYCNIMNNVSSYTCEVHVIMNVTKLKTASLYLKAAG